MYTVKQVSEILGITTQAIYQHGEELKANDLMYKNKSNQFRITEEGLEYLRIKNTTYYNKVNGDIQGKITPSTNYTIEPQKELKIEPSNEEDKEKSFFKNIYIEDLKKQLEAKDEEVRELKETIRENHNSYNILMDKNNELIQSNNELITKHNSTMEQFNTLVSDNNEKTGNLIVASEKLRELTLTNQELQQKALLLESTTKELQEKTTELENKNVELDFKSKELESTNKELEDTKNLLLNAQNHIEELSRHTSIFYKLTHKRKKLSDGT